MTVFWGTPTRALFVTRLLAGEDKAAEKDASANGAISPTPSLVEATRVPVDLPKAAAINDSIEEDFPTHKSLSQVPFQKSASQLEIEKLIKEISENELKPYDQTFHFVSDVTYTTPMVLLLGNHSSGKSSLINYLCGREIQKTGVAPTDDGFTVIRRADFDQNNDGPTTVSDPQFQFQALQPFGFNFINRFKMKIRKMPPSSKVSMDLMLVDSPGMIDTPVHVTDRTSLDGQLRGYDFLAVTRWFAQRSDVILLMFDPANPGTTGETLDVLTKSLNGLEHKFILVFNKVDMFEKVTDFARAYGTLCWNLSKVIKMKDIPQIYTTFTPDVKKVLTGNGRGSNAQDAANLENGLIPSLEVSRQRDEILEEILSAPLRRLDNLITETEESAKCVLLAAQVCNAIKWDYRQREVLMYSGLGAFCLAGPAVVFSLSTVSITATVLTTLGFMAVGFGSVVLARSYMETYQQRLFSLCDTFFDRLHPGKARTKDAELRWFTTVKPEIIRLSQASLADGRTGGVTALPSTSSRACRRVAAVIKNELPALRTRVSAVKQEESRRRWGDQASLL